MFCVDGSGELDYRAQDKIFYENRGHTVRISRQTREIINIVVAVVVVALILFYYVVYPLNKAKTYWARADSGATVTNEANDPTPFQSAGSTIDTFRLDVDAKTKLAGLYAVPPKDSIGVKGTVLLMHGNRGDRSLLASLAKALLDSGYIVAGYDQRASGKSTGEYHGDGQLEAADMEAVIAYLDIRGKIIHPFFVAGYETGADAAILAAREETRIDRIVAVAPYLSTRALVTAMYKADSPLWFPFHESTLWWWYTVRSGYATTYLEADNVGRATVPTTVLVPAARAGSEEVKRFDEMSTDMVVTIVPLAADSAAAQLQVISSILQK